MSASQAAEAIAFEILDRHHEAGQPLIVRDSLTATVAAAMGSGTTQLVLITGPPGTGKTIFCATLLRDHPDWVPYFMRSDSITVSESADATSFLLGIGTQLALRRPDLFTTAPVSVDVAQRTEGNIAEGGRLIGLHIGDLTASPFYPIALTVEQNLASVAGTATAIEIDRATIDPRLLHLDLLVQLALVDPAAELAERNPGEQIVIVVDGLDEAIEHGTGQTVIDVLTKLPPLPSNVVFIATSRPVPALARVRARFSTALTSVTLGDDPEVRKDIRKLATVIVESAQTIIADAARTIEIVERLVTAAHGNFAYLGAFQRAVASTGTTAYATELLELIDANRLPPGLDSLYAVFARAIRRQVEELGAFESASAEGAAVAAWPGVGKRLAGALCVAREPLSVAQLCEFGSIVTWASDAELVLEKFRPFLDGAQRLQFFHTSMPEYLTAEQTHLDAADIWIDPVEWHQRFVNRYRRGVVRWSAVDWGQVDNYGLRHVVDHLAAAGGLDAGTAAELVTRALRTQIRIRLGSDLPFRRLVDIAERVGTENTEGGPRFSAHVFYALVRNYVERTNRRAPQLLFEVLARGNRVAEAVAAAQLRKAGQPRFEALKAVYEALDDAQRAEHTELIGLDQLVAACLDERPSPPQVQTGPRYMVLDLRRECLLDSARLIAPHDLDRALTLATAADQTGAAHDELISEIVASAEPAAAVGLAARLRAPTAGARSAALARRGGVATPAELDECWALFEAAGPLERLRTAVYLLACSPVGDERALHALRGVLADLPDMAPRLTVQFPVTDPAEMTKLIAEADRIKTATDTVKAVVAAIDTLSDQPAVAENILDTLTPRIGNAAEHVLRDIAGAYARLGLGDKMRAAADRALADIRASQAAESDNRAPENPAQDRQEVAREITVLDPAWADQIVQTLVDELAVALEAAADDDRPAAVGQAHEVFAALLAWHPDGAARAGRLILDYTTPDCTTAQLRTLTTDLAVMACDVAVRTAQPTAAALLDALITMGEPILSFDNDRSVTVSSSPFVNRGALPGDTKMRISYMRNIYTYWRSGRDARVFPHPADVLRSVEPNGSWVGARSSWAGVVRAVVDLVAAESTELAAALCARLADPAEQAIGTANLAACGFDDGSDEVARQHLDAALARLGDIGVWFDNSLPGSSLEAQAADYLDPEQRARFEIAVRLIGRSTASAAQLARTLRSDYLRNTYRAQLAWQTARNIDPADVQLAQRVLGRVEAIRAELVDPVQADLVQLEIAVATVEAISAAAARRTLGQISRAVIARLGEILVWLREAPAPDPAALLDAMARSLSDLPLLDVAWLAANYGEILADLDHEQDAADFVNLTWAALSAAEPLVRVRAAELLAWRASDPLDVLGTALQLVPQIANPHLAAPALGNLLAPGIALTGAGFVAELLDAITENGFSFLMSSLEHAAGSLVNKFGPEVVADLDTSFRAALRVLNPDGVPEQEILDGVLPLGHCCVVPLCDTGA
jgi:hypothetical protein